MTQRFKTFNELYAAICELGKVDEQKEERLLEDYLAALLGLSQAVAEQTELSVERFYKLLADAVEAPIPAELPPVAEPDGMPDWESYAYWQARIDSQIKQLRILRQSDVLKNPMIALTGASTPETGTWYNLDIYGYLEAAANMMLYSHEDSPIEPDAVITWEEFVEFCEMGQYTE